MALTQQSSKWARPSPTIRVGVLGLFAAFLLVVPLVLAPRAEAYIYWVESSIGKIGRAKLDGTGVDRGFLDAKAVPMTVDARHIYWNTPRRDKKQGVRRAKIDGTGIDRSYITRLVPLSCFRGCYGVGDLAVDAGHIYGAAPYSDTIGRAKLDGTGVNRHFITASFPIAVATDARHVYWLSMARGDAIGRAKLDGTGVDVQFISGLDRAVDIAVGAGHIYWTNFEGGAIGRANLDGTGVDHNFITTPSRIAVERRLAIDDNHIYWNNYLEGTIGRANLNGTGVDSRFISGLDYPTNIAVNALRPVGNVTAERTQRQKGNKIRLKVTVKAKRRHTARATGKVEINPTYSLRPETMKVAKGHAKILKLKPKNKAQAKEIAAALKRGEKATAKMKVKLTDRAGNRETEKLRVRLKG